VHYANHYYGHAHILARYVDLLTPPMIWGYLQHGWNIHDGFAVGTEFHPGMRKFVWSDAVARRGWAMGRRDYHVIGSAWGYLLELERDAEQPAEREGTIFYPFHGWEGQKVLGDHRDLLRTLQEVETGPLTVCLYWTEHREESIRRVYEEAGCRVITHGNRGYAYRGTTRRFLNNQLEELRAHRRVVSNRLGSAILYGASVGCEVGVYGDPMVLENEHAVYGGMERQRRNWPELYGETVPVETAAEIAHVELGLDKLREPAEIMDLFGWTRPEDED
jgi:hypothetical protein